jgi:ABC-2 type transport system permease protein
MLVLGQLLSKTGWAVWFPWSIVPLWIGAVGQPMTALNAGSLVVVALTFLAGIGVTVAQLRFADNAQ